MNLKQYIQMLVSGWWVIVGATLLAAGIAPFYSYSQQDVYSSSATYVARSRLLTTDPGDLISSQSALAARTTLVSTFCAILESKTMKQTAIASLDLPSGTVSGYSSNCVVLTDSTIVKLTVSGPSPYLTADLANAVGSAGVEYIYKLQEVYSLQELDPASPKLTPIAPNHQFNLMLAVAVGFLGGCALSFIKWRLLTVEL
jgi:capsular polysaccharide biosynthesis protein